VAPFFRVPSVLDMVLFREIHDVVRLTHGEQGFQYCRRCLTVEETVVVALSGMRGQRNGVDRCRYLQDSSQN
jgi:hypothetical protein